jgi:hypothetical protein
MMARSINVLAVLVLPLMGSTCSNNEPNPSLLIINHNCTDLSKIPDAWIDSAQANLRLHYAHTSHGGQLTEGLTRIESSDAKYSVAIQGQALPNESSSLCIFDGQEEQTYITPDLYWQTGSGMNNTRNVLNHNPSINLSMWSWCTQVDGYSQEQVQEYLDSLSKLESEFPGVTFIYMTGNAQAEGSSGYNRYLNNELIRQYCLDNEKVLFDFADLDCWYYNGSSWDHSTYNYEEHQVPCEHDEFHGSEAAHTTYSSCEQKGRAVWWMMAVLAGWQGGSTKVEENPHPVGDCFSLSASQSAISYMLPLNSKGELCLYSSNGQLVRVFEASAGSHTVKWDGKDFLGSNTPRGVYFCQLRAADRTITKKVLVIE